MICARSLIQSHSLAHTDEPSLDMTPLLDIIFIVMVFLLLSANIQVQTLEIQVPQTEHTQALQSNQVPVIALTVLAEQQGWGMNETSYSDWQNFSRAFLQQWQQLNLSSSAAPSILIASDKHANVEQLLRLLSFLQTHNIQTTQLMMEDAP